MHAQKAQGTLSTWRVDAVYTSMKDVLNCESCVDVKPTSAGSRFLLRHRSMSMPTLQEHTDVSSSAGADMYRKSCHQMRSQSPDPWLPVPWPWQQQSDCHVHSSPNLRPALQATL